MASKASAVWTGSLKEGKGTISTATGVLSNANYSFATRFEAQTPAPPRKSSSPRPTQAASPWLSARSWAAQDSRRKRSKPMRPSRWERLKAGSPSPRSRLPPRQASPAPPRKSLTRPLPMPREAAPSPSSSLTTLKSCSTPSSSKIGALAEFVKQHLIPLSLCFGQSSMLRVG